MTSREERGRRRKEGRKGGREEGRKGGRSKGSKVVLGAEAGKLGSVCRLPPSGELHSFIL